MSGVFPCTACGQCCRNVHLSEQTSFLNRGDGVCKNFDEVTNLCKIYDERPLVCRVKDYYDKYLSYDYSWNDFVELNLQVCSSLQSKNENLEN